MYALLETGHGSKCIEKMSGDRRRSSSLRVEDDPGHDDGAAVDSFGSWASLNLEPLDFMADELLGEPLGQAVYVAGVRAEARDHLFHGLHGAALQALGNPLARLEAGVAEQKHGFLETPDIVAATILPEMGEHG